MTKISDFVGHHYRHFNSATLVEAADAYAGHVEGGGKMLVAMSGAMSTAEIGLSLAEMIRQDRVHAICCTGANLEEDVFNLVAHDSYKRIPEWRNLTRQQEKDLETQGLNRVTDTCIPGETVFRVIEQPIATLWKEAESQGERLFPHQFLYRLLREEILADLYEIDPKDSWLIAAAEKRIPLFVPGWEDSTLGNFFVAHVLAGDFPICVVPMIHQDLRRPCPYWAYFCQISDSTTSYGSYSGAIPTEKITWGKLDVDTPMFVIESDATIVAPLIFARVLGW